MGAGLIYQVFAQIDKIQDDLHKMQDELRRTREEELCKTQEGLTELQHKNAALESTVTNICLSKQMRKETLII
jgi:hypothetical protein